MIRLREPTTPAMIGMMLMIIGGAFLVAVALVTVIEIIGPAVVALVRAMSLVEFLVMIGGWGILLLGVGTVLYRSAPKPMTHGPSGRACEEVEA